MHRTVLGLERAKPSNEKAVPEKALPSTFNQPRIDHVSDKNMSKGYVKLFHTAYILIYTHTHILLEPTLSLSQFKTLVKVKRENDIRLIQGEY